MTTPIRILIADDHEIVRQGIIQICTSEPDMDVVGQASNGYEACELAVQLDPDIIILDINMPMMDGVEVTRQLMSCMPGVGIIILTMNQQYVFEAIKAGARAFLLKDADSNVLLQAIRSVAEGESVMTPATALTILNMVHQHQHDPVIANGIIFLNQRDLEILQLFAQGLDTSAVSQRLHLLESIVRSRMLVIFEKLHVSELPHALPNPIHKRQRHLLPR